MERQVKKWEEVELTQVELEQVTSNVKERFDVTVSRLSQMRTLPDVKDVDKLREMVYENLIRLAPREERIVGFLLGINTFELNDIQVDDKVFQIYDELSSSEILVLATIFGIPALFNGEL